MDAVSSTLQGLELNQPPAAVAVPSVAETVGSTMSRTEFTAYQATIAENQRLTRELAAKGKQCKETNKNQGTGKSKRWKMDQYCSTHGVNSMHGSSNTVAAKGCQYPGPNHNPMAMYENKMGGRLTNLALYGKWKDRKDNYYDTKYGE